MPLTPEQASLPEPTARFIHNEVNSGIDDPGAAERFSLHTLCGTVDTLGLPGINKRDIYGGVASAVSPARRDPRLTAIDGRVDEVASGIICKTMEIVSGKRQQNAGKRFLQ